MIGYRRKIFGLKETFRRHFVLEFINFLRTSLFLITVSSYNESLLRPHTQSSLILINYSVEDFIYLHARFLITSLLKILVQFVSP